MHYAYYFSKQFLKNHDGSYYITYIFYVTYIYYIHYTNYQLFVQVCIDLRIADHVWQEKCTAIASTVDGLGDMFKPELCAGLLAYTSETYSDGAAAAAASPVGEGALVTVLPD